MIQKLLIANRGEIAVRIIRACREMGIATVAVYSEADKDSLHTQLADEAVCIGPAPSKDSYLNMERIISAAMVTGADAVHPGFGFLSENARFAEVCEKCGLTFVGPSSNVIRALGNKQIARNTMVSAGIPVIPGTDHPILEVEEGEKEADRIGYPVIVKAALGGGGKGMRTAWTREEFSQAFLTAKKEAESAFGDGTMYIEHFVEHPRHIEFQILADSQGNVIHLGERDCSIQRNHQKMIEESPSAAISPELRSAMGKAAVGAAKAAGYVNAGTIEFLLEGDGRFYFMEMNTRIQVTGSGKGAASDRFRPAAFREPGGSPPGRSCHRMPDQCGEPGEGIPSFSRKDFRIAFPGGKRCTGGYRDLQWLSGASLL